MSARRHSSTPPVDPRAARSQVRGLGRLICVAALLHAVRAGAEPTAKITKGPYLQDLTSTSLEIRAELDGPAPVAIKVTDGSDAGPVRAVRDDTPTAMHVVRVQGLLPATHYSYSFTVGSNVANVIKGDFTTAPPVDSAAPFTFLIYGDNRTDDAGHAAIVRAMLASPSDFVINTGDLVQDGSSDANWQTFFDVEAPLIRSRSVFACVGNHELTDGAGANYLRYFGPTSDAHGDGEKPKLYGSFRWAGARFFLLDAMETFDSGPERAWLDDELSRADAEPGLVWRVVVMHHSPWSAGPHGGNARALRAGIPALLAAHHIDLILAGHDHIYERGFASGLRYLISGGGGAPLYEIEHRLPSTRRAESVHHIIEVLVDKDAMRIVSKRDDGSVVERCGMTKARDGWDCDPAPAAPLRSEAPAPAPTRPATKSGCRASGPTAKGSAGAASGFLALAAFAALAGYRSARGRNRG